jgi:hypothetical protein
MPPALVKAHAELDRTVDLCYRPQPFTSEHQRVEYLFGLYQPLTAPFSCPPRRVKAARSRFPDAEEAFCGGGRNRHLDLHR